MAGGIKMVNLVKYKQTHEIGSEMEALFSVIIPILRGILYSLKREHVEMFGGYEKITLEQLAMAYKEGDGDCGICFEYAVHDAIISGNADVLERVNDALTRYCKIKVGDPTSILFGAEKEGALQLIESASNLLTDDSYLLPGTVGKPIKLKKHIQGVVNAFKKPSERAKLPNSINGLWKADLFVGKPEAERWVGTTVKINPKQLEAACGLRLAVVPGKQGKGDNITFNELKNLIVCPMPYDQSFVELFYQGWNDIKQFLNAQATLLSEQWVPHGDDRFVCKQLENRKKFPVLEILKVIDIFKQPHLLETEDKLISVATSGIEEPKISAIISPFSL